MGATNSTAMSVGSYIETPIKPSRKRDLMVISEMHSSKIIYFLAYRHRVGLLMCSTALLATYVAWDKLLHLFI